MAIKGISKLSPQLGDFLKRGESMGLNVEEGLGFLRGKVNASATAQQQKNIVEIESPELHQFIDQEIKKGRSPVQAGAIAQQDAGKYKKVIDKLVKDHKAPWSSILESVYGQGMAQQAHQDQDQMQQQQPPSQQQAQMQLQQGQQSGQGQAALMEILQKLQQQRGAR
jgi:hypothetical protein